jgi:hypothetical protein
MPCVHTSAGWQLISLLLIKRFIQIHQQYHSAWAFNFFVNYSMPFTFSHPALVLPLYAAGKKYLSLPGLVMGSIAPDFEYFLRMKKGISYYSHTTAGLLYFNLPLSLVLLFVFHEIVRNLLILHLPPLAFQTVLYISSISMEALFQNALGTCGCFRAGGCHYPPGLGLG